MADDLALETTVRHIGIKFATMETMGGKPMKHVQGMLLRYGLRVHRPERVGELGEHVRGMKAEHERIAFARDLY